MENIFFNKTVHYLPLSKRKKGTLTWLKVIAGLHAPSDHAYSSDGPCNMRFHIYSKLKQDQYVPTLSRLVHYFYKFCKIWISRILKARNRVAVSKLSILLKTKKDILSTNVASLLTLHYNIHTKEKLDWPSRNRKRRLIMKTESCRSIRESFLYFLGRLFFIMNGYFWE